MTAIGPTRAGPQASPAAGLDELAHSDSVALAERHTRVLELLASGAVLPEVLDAITAALEELMPGALCSVLLLDAQRRTLHHGAAPSLPQRYSAAIDGIAVAPDAGSCGAAAFLGVPVCAEDITIDARWERYRALAAEHALRACWSSPILGREGAAVGTFAVYYTRPHRPSRREEQLVGRFTHLASLAIEHATLFGALAESEERFRRTFEDNAVGMALTEPDGRFSRVNTALGQMLGYQPEELLGTDFGAVLHPDGVASGYAVLRRLVDGERASTQFETRCVHRDGTSLLIAATASVVADSAGTPVYLSLNLLDVTQRRAAQADRRGRREAEIARGAAEAASQAKSEFLSAFSHELRTPLQAITGFTELLGTLALPPERRSEALAHITEASTHILSLVDDVRDVAKIEAGALALHITDVPIADVAGEVLDLLEPLAAQRQVSLRRDGLPGHARTDHRRTRQILLNLVNNAIRYNHNGGSVRLAATTEAGEVTIRVVDSGPGIPAEHANRLFTPFDRLGAEAGPEPGSGLGLALSRGLAEAMGGRLAVRNLAEAGACVTLTLPEALPGMLPGAGNGTSPGNDPAGG